MLILIVLILVAILAILLGIYFFNEEYLMLGLVFITIFLVSIVYLVIHIGLWSTAGNIYESLVIERQAIVLTLEHARATENNIELAAITRTICDYNAKLSQEKLLAKRFFTKDYVDERTLEINFIQ